MRNLMLIVHFIGLAMGVGTGIANFFLGRAASKMDKSEALKFIFNTFVLKNHMVKSFANEKPDTAC